MHFRVWLCLASIKRKHGSSSGSEVRKRWRLFVSLEKRNESECPQRVEEGGIPTPSLLLLGASRKVVMRGETDLYKRLESRWWPAVEIGRLAEGSQA
jgi:hypothetical protein